MDQYVGHIALNEQYQYKWTSSHLTLATSDTRRDFLVVQMDQFKP